MKDQVRTAAKNGNTYTLKPKAGFFVDLKNKKSWTQYIIPLKKRKKENISERVDKLLYSK